MHFTSISDRPTDRPTDQTNDLHSFVFFISYKLTLFNCYYCNRFFQYDFVFVGVLLFVKTKYMWHAFVKLMYTTQCVLHTHRFSALAHANYLHKGHKKAICSVLDIQHTHTHLNDVRNACVGNALSSAYCYHVVVWYFYKKKLFLCSVKIKSLNKVNKIEWFV